MELYLTEKPKVGRALARILGANDSSQEGYATDGNQIYVTWAVGHLMEVFEPEEYDPKWKRWDAAHLPIIPSQFQQKVKPRLAKQFKVIEKLLKKATTVYIATDIDREGESIARELMDSAGYWGDVYRVPIASLDTTSIRKALQSIQPGELTYNLYHAAIGRTRADWLIGMNFSRLATLTAQSAGSRESLPVGRVLTAIVALVANHDRRRQDFKAHDYFSIDLSVDFAAGGLRASWVPPSKVSDDHGRCIDGDYAAAVSEVLPGREVIVTDVTTKVTSQAAPLPFDMTTLQQYCANRWGYSSSKTLKACQELYETHTAVTYPRSDCKYLPESQRSEVPDIVSGLAKGDPSLADKLNLVDTDKKSPAYNTEKVGAHHAIIPTTKPTTLKDLPEVERNVFDAIRLRFLALFCPPYTAEKTKISLTCAEQNFRVSGSVPTAQGWKALYGGDSKAADPKDTDGDEDEESGQSQAALPKVSKAESGKATGAAMEKKQTQPPKAFTESALLGAMNNVSRFVDEPELKKILDEKDGIGTQATRAGILDNAFRYNYLLRSKKTIVATDKAFAMLKIVPPAIASPGMTAGWEKQLGLIADGQLSLEDFEMKVTKWVDKLVRQGVARIEAGDVESVRRDFSNIEGADSGHTCFECEGPLRQISGKQGKFWACQNREKCGATFSDSRGKPKKREKQPDNAPDCPECGKVMRLRIAKAKPKKGKGKGSDKFWGCSGFPGCKTTAEYQESA